MIELIDIYKKYDSNLILNNISLKIEEKEFVGIIGKSGSGKSTLLNIIGQIDTNYDGKVIINGVETNNLTPKKREEFIRYNINYLFQNFALVDTMSVEDNLMIGLEYSNLSKKEKIEKIKKALNELDLINYQKKKVFTLSGGEQQRVALARIMIKEGNIILADEPTGNLDFQNSMVVMQILKKLQEKGKTIIVVTHSEDIAKLCDRTINLK